MSPRVVIWLSALAAAGAVTVGADAKAGRLTMMVSSSTPRVGQTVIVTVRTARASSTDRLRLIAVAPGGAVMSVVSTVIDPTYASSPANLPHDGFGLLMRRLSTTTWRATVRFTRPGAWQLVVPNWVLEGYAMPLPLVRSIRVGT